jgi:hypothetical protein
MKSAGIVLAVAGGVVLAAGIPVWVVGARRVPVKKPEAQPETQPEAPRQQPVQPTALLRIGPAGASFEMVF